MNFSNSRLVDHKPMKFGTFVPYMYHFVIIVKYLTNFFKLEWNLGIKFTLRFFFLSVYILAPYEETHSVTLTLGPSGLPWGHASPLSLIEGFTETVEIPPSKPYIFLFLMIRLIHCHRPCVLTGMPTNAQNLLWNRWLDFHKTWYVALGTGAHHSLFKWWPWDDLDLI